MQCEREMCWVEAGGLEGSYINLKWTHNFAMEKRNEKYFREFIHFRSSEFCSQWCAPFKWKTIRWRQSFKHGDIFPTQTSQRPRRKNSLGSSIKPTRNYTLSEVFNIIYLLYHTLTTFKNRVYKKDDGYSHGYLKFRDKMWWSGIF